MSELEAGSGSEGSLVGAAGIGLLLLANLALALASFVGGDQLIGVSALLTALFLSLVGARLVQKSRRL
jgi:hypothetical protein